MQNIPLLNLEIWRKPALENYNIHKMKPAKQLTKYRKTSFEASGVTLKRCGFVNLLLHDSVGAIVSKRGAIKGRDFEEKYCANQRHRISDCFRAFMGALRKDVTAERLKSRGKGAGAVAWSRM